VDRIANDEGGQLAGNRSIAGSIRLIFADDARMGDGLLLAVTTIS